MKRTKEEMGEKLNELLEKSYDAEKGFQKAAEKVKNDRLSDFFRQKSQERKMFIKELRDEIAGYGQVPENGGSSTGSMHRTWMDLKTALSGDDEEVILQETLKGEQAALEDYKDITTETDLPPSLNSKLNRQQRHIQTSINNVKMYEQMFD
ncbi:ferritin-like domain-containing protein [Salegentibacter sediminis]|uniref:ferritin-like domain-containing protein n=1 Tax=Salegentibacter sediminis TaxID=1930251 RepID=UPI0009BED559|nr:PA2169 family four-helix-bundle protein [Salegentibacter sediminis]